MKSKLFLFLLVIFNSAVLESAQENSNPEQIIDRLHQQMKELNTLRADYLVDTIDYQSLGNEIQFKVSYIKSGDKYSMTEQAYEGDEQIQEDKYVYDGINIKFFHFEKKKNIKVGSVHSKGLNEVFQSTNRKINALEFLMIPKLRNTLSYIFSELDENEREEFFRLKKIQKLKKE